MTNLSRRSVIVAAISTSTATLPNDLKDPLVDGLSNWMAQDAKIEAMQLRWQSLESRVFDRAKILAVSPSTLVESEAPEVATMRLLDREIDAQRQVQKEMAGRLLRVRAGSLDGALAKVELGLKVQGPYDWQEHALELLEAGIAELRQFGHAFSG